MKKAKTMDAKRTIKENKKNAYYQNHGLEKIHKIKRKSSQKYYYTPGSREKLSHYRKLRYQMDEDYRNKQSTYLLNYYKQHKEEISKKAKLRYQLRKNKANNNLEINNNIVTSF